MHIGQLQSLSLLSLCLFVYLSVDLVSHELPFLSRESHFRVLCVVPRGHCFLPLLQARIRTDTFDDLVNGDLFRLQRPLPPSLATSSSPSPSATDPGSDLATIDIDGTAQARRAPWTHLLAPLIPSMPTFLEAVNAVAADGTSEPVKADFFKDDITQHYPAVSAWAVRVVALVSLRRPGRR